MGSANKVPICFAGYDASDIRRVVSVSGLTGFVITSLGSRNLMEPIGRLELFPVSRSHRCATLQRLEHGGLISLAAGHDRPDNAGNFVGHRDAGQTGWFAGEQREEAQIRRLGFVFGSADQRDGGYH